MWAGSRSLPAPAPISARSPAARRRCGPRPGPGWAPPGGASAQLGQAGGRGRALRGQVTPPARPPLLTPQPSRPSACRGAGRLAADMQGYIALAKGAAGNRAAAAGGEGSCGPLPRMRRPSWLLQLRRTFVLGGRPALVCCVVRLLQLPAAPSAHALHGCDVPGKAALRAALPWVHSSIAAALGHAGKGSCP